MGEWSYLYSSDHIPDQKSGKEITSNLIDINWNKFGASIIQKILVSSNAQACRSATTRHKGLVNIAGDYEGGVNALHKFFEGIDFPFLKPFFKNVIDTLNNDSNKKKYFILNTIEIATLVGEKPQDFNALLLAEITKENDSPFLSLKADMKERQETLNEFKSEIIKINLDDPSSILPADFLKLLRRLDLEEWCESQFKNEYRQFIEDFTISKKRRFEQEKKAVEEAYYNQILVTDDLANYKNSKWNAVLKSNMDEINKLQILEAAILGDAPTITDYLIQSGFQYRRYKINEGSLRKENRDKILALMEKYPEAEKVKKAVNHY